MVVTGIGALTPLGLDVPSTWQGLITGKSGIDYITLCDREPLEIKFAGEVKGFDPLNYLDRKEARRSDLLAKVLAARTSAEVSGHSAYACL